MVNKIPKVFYWADMMGDVEEEAEILGAMFLENNDITFQRPIEIKEYDKCLEENFDILFFDWGGMSIGNSTMDFFCRYILDHADNHPNRIYIMNSVFTGWAMEELLDDVRDGEIPANVFLSGEDAVPLLKLWYGEDLE